MIMLMMTIVKTIKIVIMMKTMMTTMMMMLMMMRHPFTDDLILSVRPSVWQKSGYTETSACKLAKMKKMMIISGYAETSLER